MAGLRNPTGGLLELAACWLARAMKPAHNGAEALVPVTAKVFPLLDTTQMSAATHATSGVFL